MKSTYRLRLATLGSIDLELDSLARAVAADDLGRQLELHALLLEDLLGLLCDLGVHAGAANLVQEFDDGNLGAQARPHGSHLETNDTATNDEHLFRDLLQRNGTSARDHPLLVDLQAGEGSRLTAGGDQDVLAHDAGFATVVQLDLDLVLVDEGAGALQVLDTVLLEEEFNALGETSNGRVFGLHELGQVEFYIVDLDTAVLGVVEDGVVEM